MNVKCMVRGCPNESDYGTFIGDLCFPCYTTITTGKISPHSMSFISALKRENDKLKEQLSEVGVTNHDYIQLPNGCALFWKKNQVGGRTYCSDEIGGGVVVWDTSLVDESTLLTAIVQEQTLRRKEIIEERKAKGLKL